MAAGSCPPIPQAELESLECYQEWYRKSSIAQSTSVSAGFFKPEVVSAFNSQLNGRLQARPAADYLFRSISGSGLRSPRCRYGGDACVVLRYFRSGWYLVRTLRPRRLDASRAPAPDDVRRQRCFRFYVLRQLNDVVPSASFDWILTDDPTAAGHFETYTANDDVIISRDDRTTTGSARYALIVGPPMRSRATSSGEDHHRPIPTTCVVDLERRPIIEAVDLRPTGNDRHRQVWPTIVAFDPRRSRDHIAAAVCTGRSYAYLPRDTDDDESGVALFDFRSRRIVCFIATLTSSVTGSCCCWRFRSGRLQYVRDGRHVLATVCDVTSGDRTPTCAVVLLSSDDLAPLVLLPFYNEYDGRPMTSPSPILSTSSGCEFHLLVSADTRRLTLVWNDPRSRRRTSPAKNVDAELERDSSNNAGSRETVSGAGDHVTGSSRTLAEEESSPNGSCCCCRCRVVVDLNNNSSNGSSSAFVGGSDVVASSSCQSVDGLAPVAATYRVPAGLQPVTSLVRICSTLVGRLVPRRLIDRLPVPALLKAGLVECSR